MLRIKFSIEPYSQGEHSEQIRRVYGEAFDDEPWPQDWASFDEFDPNGVFVARDYVAERVVGYVICFKRGEIGYVSVVAVTPAFQRQGIASALVHTAVEYLRSLHLDTVKIDAFVDSIPAVETYKSLGFEIESTFEG